MNAAAVASRKRRTAPILRAMYRNPGIVMSVYEIGTEAGFDMRDDEEYQRVCTALAYLAREKPEEGVSKLEGRALMYQYGSAALADDTPLPSVSTMNGAGAGNPYQQPKAWRPASWPAEDSGQAPAPADPVFVSTPVETSPASAELAAMTAVAAALEPLDADARKRVMAWARSYVSRG